MKLYFFLVVAGIQWCCSTQESLQSAATIRLLRGTREGGHRAKRMFPFTSKREQTYSKELVPLTTKPDRENHQVPERHQVTKREVTAEDIIKKLPRVYEPGSATRYSYPTDSSRSLADQTHFFSNSSVANGKSIIFASVEDEFLKNRTGDRERERISEIGVSTKGEQETTKAVPKSSSGTSNKNGYNFLLKQLQQYMKKSTIRTADSEKTLVEFHSDNSSAVHESREGNSTASILHKSKTFRNETHSESSTEEQDKVQIEDQTVTSESSVETGDTAAEQGDNLSLSPKEADDEFTELLQADESTLMRGHPEILLRDSSTTDLETAKSFEKSEDETRKSHPIFKIKVPLIYANSDKMLSTAINQQIISADKISNTTNPVPLEALAVNVRDIAQPLAVNKTNNGQILGIFDDHENTTELSVSANVTTPQSDAVKENHEARASTESTINENSKAIPLVRNTAPPEGNVKIDGNNILEDAKNISLLQKLFNVENLPLSQLSENPELENNSSNTGLNYSTPLEKESSSENPLTFLSQNYTGLLQNVPVSPARLIPQNILGFNFNPSKPFNIHSPRTSTPSFPSSSSGLLGLESLGLSPWNPSPYLPNSGSTDFTSSQHFGTSALGLPSSLRGPSFSENPNTLAGVNLGGLDFLSLLSSLGGFNSPTVPTSVDFSSSGSGRSPYSIGSSSSSFQSTPVNQLILKRFGLPEAEAAGKTLDSSALTGVHSSFEAPFSGESRIEDSRDPLTVVY